MLTREQEVRRTELSAQRLQEFQEKKRAEQLARQVAAIRPHRSPFMPLKELERRAKLRVQLRSLFWRAWARYKPIFGGVALGYTSLREQYVYKRAAKLYAAALKPDPGKSGRPLAAWLRRATPMEMETASVASSAGSQPSKRAKKSRGSRVQGAAGGVVGPGG